MHVKCTGIILTHSINDYISALSAPDALTSLANLGRGIERESLRVLRQGRLSTEPHYPSLGSALTHGQITTDYSETLLEFITPVSQKPETSIAQLQDIQKFVFSEIDGELLWPMSMPCFVENADTIPLAQYGSSNIGRMKTVYRQGLKNRYGSMMQVISGIHFNFSFPQSFWLTLKEVENDEQKLQDYVSDKYFAMLRNYKRYCWLIPYLFGSSPVICPSFLQGKETTLPFKKSDNGYLYLEYATSLRMSDLGYTNSEQSSLYICYNNIENYVKQVQKAIRLPSDKFAKIGVKVNGEYCQLNGNILQIENELYSPIRPKRVANSGEKPSEALKNRGVEYIEVRALDVNPFSDTGISIEQVYFLDILLTYCALLPSPALNKEEMDEFDSNMNDVVNQGRDPKLLLLDNGIQKSVPVWGQEIFNEMKTIAELLDNANNTDKYTKVLEQELEKILDPSLTPSAKIVKLVVDDNISLSEYALKQANTYREQSFERPYQFYDQQHFIKASQQSHEEQAQIEVSDELSFDEFLKNYFSY
jgi:glutamate--cysteine ligase